jgi:predicted pyridoxine 5'-phosphate oxidase superfamily flavin-nucleotide-binding protein
MSRAYSDIAFTPTVRAVQTRLGSRSGYEPLDHTDDRRDALGDAEAAFIEARDGFYQATVGETGWPYVQFRGGPAGFLKVLDAKTIGYADFRGNVQYISVGNLNGNDRVSIILMDYANRRRLKILGRVRLVDERDDPALVARLELPHYRARVERAVVITVEAYDWNCPQHITPRFTEQEIAQAVAPLHAEISTLKKALAESARTRCSMSADQPL